MATVTLADYANDRENVVIFWTSIGNPTGDYTLIGHPDFDFAARRDLLDLTGEIDADGEWLWDGQGGPTDDRANDIRGLTAYVNQRTWARMAEEWENGE